jgi:signal transduction histidine kinase
VSTRRGRLFRRYVAIFTVLATGAVLTSALVQGYFAYREYQAALLGIQQEQAAAAAAQIRRLIQDTERQVRWAFPPPGAAGGATLDRRRAEYGRLLRQVAAVTEVAYLDAVGGEQLRLSRLSLDVEESGVDRSSQAPFLEAKTGRTYFGPVYYRDESEPYLTIAVGESPPAAGVTVAEVNLKFAWDVVSPIRIGQAGYVYVVDAGGHLIAHPEISLVLQKTNVSGLPQVREARGGPGPDRAVTAMVGWDMRGRRVLSAHEAIDPPGWYVFVEQPLAEAFAPLYGSALRTTVLVGLWLGLSVLASLFLAGRMVRPIRALEAGVAQIRGGALGHRIDVRTGDELEALAGEFNQMSGQLRRFTEDLQRSRERLVTAREEERRRVRRDLHDGLGPMLGSLTLKLDAAGDLVEENPAAARALLRDLKVQTQAAIADIRRLVYALRPPALDDLGLVAALREEVMQHELGGRRVTIDVPEPLPPLPAAVEVAVYRIAQEALSNVARHAGARHCAVRLALGDGALQFEVSDDGRGLALTRGRGVGLTSMRERAEELGGTCRVEALSTGGTRVRATLPLTGGATPPDGRPSAPRTGPAEPKAAASTRDG